MSVSDGRGEKESGKRERRKDETHENKKSEAAEVNQNKWGSRMPNLGFNNKEPRQ